MCVRTSTHTHTHTHTHMHSQNSHTVVRIFIEQPATQKDAITFATTKPAHVFMKRTQEATVSRMAPTVHLLTVPMTFDLQCMISESFRLVERMKTD